MTTGLQRVGGTAAVAKRYSFVATTVGSDQCVRRDGERRKAGLNSPAVNFQTVLDIALQNLAVHEIFTPRLWPSPHWSRQKRRGSPYRNPGRAGRCKTGVSPHQA